MKVNVEINTVSLRCLGTIPSASLHFLRGTNFLCLAYSLRFGQGGSSEQVGVIKVSRCFFYQRTCSFKLLFKVPIELFFKGKLFLTEYFRQGTCGEEVILVTRWIGISF